MSTVVRTQTRVKAQGTAKVRVSMWDLVRAEVTRSRRTFTWGVIGATLIFTVHTIILANASISSGVVTELQWNGMLWRGCICMPGASPCLWGC